MVWIICAAAKNRKDVENIPCSRIAAVAGKEGESPMTNKNKEGYPDPTAAKAIREAEKPEELKKWFVRTVKEMADIFELEVAGEIPVRNKKRKKYK